MKEGEDRRWEFLGQLRLIYLSLVATCFLLLVGNNLQSNLALENAFRDSENIRANASRLDDWVSENNPLDLWSEIESVNKKQPAYISYHGMTFYVIPSTSTNAVEVDASDIEKFPTGEIFEYSQPVSGYSLAWFIKIWNETHAWRQRSIIIGWDLTKATVTAQGEDILISASAIPADNIRDFPNRSEFALKRDGANKEWELIETIHKHVRRTVDEPDPLPDSKIHIPVQLRHGREDLQANVIQALKLDWRPGSFDQSFPDLSKLSGSISSLALDDLQKHIADLRASGSETVDVFGAKIPSDFLRTWGLFVLIAAQFYYYVHIRQFHRIFGSERSVPSFPWIACYSDIAARYAYVVSLTLIPSATAADLVLGHLTVPAAYLQSALSVAATLCVLGLAILTWREISVPQKPPASNDESAD
jgi:hypothetical protein